MNIRKEELIYNVYILFYMNSVLAYKYLSKMYQNLNTNTSLFLFEYNSI